MTIPRPKMVYARKRNEKRMNSKLLVAATLLVAPLAAPAATNDLTALLQQGMFDEEATRDLTAAIADYQSLARQYDKDRQVAATAIYRLGECYRKLGQTNEAAIQYRRLVRDFPEQADLAQLSRQNLAGLGSAPAAPATTDNSSSAAASGASTEANAEVATLKAQLAALADSPDRRKILAIAQQTFPNPVLTTLLQKLAEQEVSYAALTNDYALNNPAVQRVTSELKVLNNQIDDQINGIMISLRIKLQVATERAKALQAQAGHAQRTVAAAGIPHEEEDQAIQRIQQLIQNSPDLINDPGQRLLYVAASAGQLQVVNFLLDHGADINLVSGGDTPLNAATAHGNKAMVELLLSRGAEVNARVTTGGTVLHTAVENGFQAVAETLLQHHANVNAPFPPSNGGETPLHLAVLKSYPNLVNLLLKYGADINATNGSGRTPLFHAINHSRPDLIQKLLAAGANPNLQSAEGRTPLSYAAEQRTPDIIQQLLDAKADPNAGTFNLPLLMSIRQGNIQGCELLLAGGASTTRTGLVNWGVPHYIFSFPRNGPYSPLEIAITQKNPDAVRLLLAHKADANTTNAAGAPLTLDALPQLEIFKALLAAGANANWYPLPVPSDVNSGNESLLMLAVDRNLYNTPEDKLAAARLLLDSGANPNAKNLTGLTPLHIAAYGGQLELVRLLLDHHADPNIANNGGITPLDEAKNQNHPEVVALLHGAGALDYLPRWDCLTLTRPSDNIIRTIFRKGTNDWNHFTLLEMLAVQYQFLAANAGGESQTMNRADLMALNDNRQEALSFPDLVHVHIRRPGADPQKWQEFTVDAKAILQSGNPTNDVPLQWGDVVEIPETDHALNEHWRGFSTTELAGFVKGLTHHVQIINQGQSSTVDLAPSVNDLNQVLTKMPYWIRPVLFKTGMMLVSSDLAHVKISRKDPATGKPQEWIVDCSDPNNIPDFWLRNGDVVEVPQR